MTSIAGDAAGLASFRLAKVEALVFRVPVEQPVQTSFGIMHDRPAVLVRVEDTEGAVGWGEIWCNFPSVGAEHRARLLESAVAPILLERAWDTPEQAFDAVSKRLHVLGIQTGEPGTIAQTIAGADIALWDLVARRIGQPLWRLFGGTNRIGVYASGLNPTEPERLAAAKRDEGFRAFKLKVGFGAERDASNLRGLRDLLGDDATLMVDANQAWDVDQAAEMARRLADFRLQWMEEPIPADRPWSEWVQLAGRSPIPLAAGENMRGHAQFAEALSTSAFAVVQPDLGKWGGFSGCLPVARAVLGAGRMFCPHWLGGGIGLVASMHLKAAVGGAGYVEVDANPNPLRELLARPYPAVVEGAVTLCEEPGLGVAPDLDAVRGLRVKHAYR
ncbi:mandelate racemase/muconate lactonizing enzyme family protein [Ramlibacter ginsenosidimutans]|uniref:Mandelate racemase/muconate lactonizing enzyme family protein n=1 Tax=Ramlibacter ginsenosidimutans TaxID=502333 RepID=A0A934TTE9_9BURK|nr:mandelate racemase/muconate lactonizing enzyme family protein [Ramlibacter ginsenosidimutans]MBK6006580.1 mandelate racemase/muconate lactonizing enzyme family protein [Ramlibacter ginsenosidimutans]